MERVTERSVLIVIVTPGDVLAGDEHIRVARVFVIVNAEPNQTLAGSFPVELGQFRHQVNTRLAPGCPEFDEDWFAAEAAERGSCPPMRT